jgi:translation initiation factor 5A
MNLDDEFIFESGNAGASDTIPIKAGSCKKGIHVMLKGNPCKIIEIATSKTGKHGHAKVNITGIDIFSGKKYQESSPTSHNLMQPIITKQDYQLIELDDDNFLTLMDENGAIREDLSLDPEDIESNNKLKEDFKKDKEIVVTIQKCIQKEKVIAYKLVTS